MSKKTAAIDERIAKAQEAVDRIKAKYESAVKKLEFLKEKKDQAKIDELLKAVENSSRSFDEIIAFAKSGDEKKPENVRECDEKAEAVEAKESEKAWKSEEV